MGQECIYKITVISPLSELERGLNIICEKYDNPQGLSFVFLTAQQCGLNTDNIFDLDSFSSLVLATQSTIEQFIIIFGIADIIVEYVDFEYKLYNDFDLNRIEPQLLKDKMIRHMASKLNYNHVLGKIISRRKLNQIDYMIMQNKLIS
jgi:hypothetical protein